VGHANVAMAYTLYGGKLDDRAMRLLVWMALVSLDEPGNPMLDYEPCRYWQGWEAQAEALGYRVPPAGDKSRRDVYRSLQRVRARLVKAGAITKIERSDHRTAWRLQLRL
jgi:hypothetical protein